MSNPIVRMGRKMMENKVVINENSFQVLINLLKSKTGLNLDYYRRTFILRRIKARMVRINCTNLDKYNTFLLSNEEELKKFVNSFNINYTYFFRDWDVYAIIQNLFLKTMGVDDEGFLNVLRPNIPISDEKPKRKKVIEQEISYNSTLISNIEQLSLYKKIRSLKSVKVPIYIWSCACATGEEPYSLAMMLQNLKTSVSKHFDYDVIASDIDKYAISSAREGIYGSKSIRNVSKYYETKYFKKIKQDFGYKHQISPKIRNSVTLLNEDITKISQYSWKFDIIFCRNLLIYFNIENRNKFLRIINKQLNEGGLLVLGKTESLFHKSYNFKLIDPKAHIYIKSRTFNAKK